MSNVALNLRYIKLIVNRTDINDNYFLLHYLSICLAVTLWNKMQKYEEKQTNIKFS